MAETYSLSVTQSCLFPTNGNGELTATTSYSAGGGPISSEVGTTLFLLNSLGVVIDQRPADRATTVDFSSLSNQAYSVEWRETDSGALLANGGATVQCGPLTGNSLLLDGVSHTDETAALDDGTATIQASGGTAPLTAELLELLMSQPATSGQPVVFTALPPGRYTLQVTDSSQPAQVVSGQVEVLAYRPPKAGCQDEYADNFDPAATTGGAATCTYTPRWRAAWQPMAVRVGAVAGQTDAFIAAELRIGFRPGHPLAADRPLGAPLALRATVGPDGYATFVLGPYLRPALGVADGYGGYRLDLNTQTVDDGYVGYELRRTDGTLLEHGYAVNAAVPDAFLVDGAVLTAFASVPTWPGYSWERAKLTTLTTQYGAVDEVYPPAVTLPCPLNPLPVAWLNPQGGFDFWVFQNRPVLGDSVSEGQQYREALSGERRYSDPGEAYQTYKASSGVFKGDALLTGLRTLWRSPQAWAQLVPGGPWVAILVERGSREVGRLGVTKNEVPLSFQVAMPEWAQGQ